VRDADDTAARPRYFVLLGWDGARIAAIRDFRYARYAIEQAEVAVLTLDQHGHV
jgi:RNA polymerase sigma-70 factor (ECF subfamily)